MFAIQLFAYVHACVRCLRMYVCMYVSKLALEFLAAQEELEHMYDRLVSILVV